MNVQIRKVRYPGELRNERIVMRVHSATNIGEFAAFRSSQRDGVVTNYVPTVYWFPDKEVKEGDLVVLYTKEGVQKERVNPDATTSHFFYWGHDRPLWEDPQYAVVLIHIDQWQSHLLTGSEPASSTRGEAQRT